jgi:hypothetical protein
MLGNSIEFGSKFSHRPMVDFASFMRSMNMATQAFAIDGSNAENVQTTGTAAAVVNGVPVASLPADAELDISADLQLSIWLTATAYTSADMRYVTDDNGNKQYYRCIASHTSNAATKPGQKDSINTTWRTYWTESSQTAEAAVGNSIAQDDTYNYLCLATALGVITLVKADDGAGNLRIPNFEPEMFVAIGYLTVTPTSGAHILGTTALTTVGTFTQIIGPALPQGAAIDKN